MNKLTEERCKVLKEIHLDAGWKLFEETPELLSFVWYEDEEHEWFKDYDKQKGSFTQLNGRQKVNLIISKEAA